ncbi:MAG: NADH-quinone oxidoreductase subunit L [Bacteroidales bacterium]|nr:NADH-quinone oxidoreductase subunit L [Bacteroidales bacterium]
MNLIITYLEIIILLPVIAGVILFFLPEKYRKIKSLAALAVSLMVLYYTVKLYFSGGAPGQINLIETGFLNWLGTSYLSGSSGNFFMLNLDNLARFILLLVAFFSVLILLYSYVYMDRKNALRNYYSLILLTLWASVCTVLSDSLFMFIFFWGFLGLTLYKLIKGHDEESSAAAKKTFIMIGASDGIMILGIGILWKITGHFNISELTVRTSDAIRFCAFLALLIGSFTKAGAFPFHTWVPDFAKNAPAPSSAYLPASLDKLLGIYFLTRICNDIFILSGWIRLVILILGGLTIIIAVMMALIQHNYKKLLGYHAVSQVGYMVTGIGLGSVLGLVGGLFHMVNHALYKSGLFLASGCIESKTGTDKLEKLGGLSRQMPITFICSLIFALSISGVPPLNGFASKWIIYQGIIDFGKGTGMANHLWIVWLSMAVIGSALTLASFIKFISGIFLGRSRTGLKKVKEVSWMMWTPMLILALICTGFGIFASKWIIPALFEPVTGSVTFIGVWDSSFISLLIAVSIILGISFYLIFSMGRFRTDESFIGGETNRRDVGFEPTSFYETIRNFGILKPLYGWAERKYFDIYDVSKIITLKISHLFSAAHNGILSNLAFWVLAGLIFMFIFLLI